MGIVELLQGIIGFGLDVVSILFRMFLFAIVQVVMNFKNRNGLLWGILVFFFPWAILLIFWIPRKMPKLSARHKGMEAFHGLNPVVASIMALSAMIAKSDGHVSEEEIILVKQFVARNFRMGKEELDRYKGAFDYGKNHPEEYGEFAKVVRGYYTNRMTLLGLAYLFIGLAQTKSQGAPADEVLLRNIIYAMGISQMEYTGMKNSYYARQNGGNWGGWQGSFAGGGQYAGQAPPRVDQTKRYADVLGVSVEASTQEIKSAYRKIVKEFHPDKVASKGMPKEYVDYATQKVKDANEAYEYLMKHKGA